MIALSVESLIAGKSKLQSGYVEINSVKENEGFSNNVDGVSILHNGTAFNGALPEMGYDEDEELNGDGKRALYGLPKKEEELPAQDDVEGISHIITGGTGELVRFEATLSTTSGQVAIAPDAARCRLDHEADKGRGDHGIDGVASGLQYRYPGLGLGHLATGDDAALGDQFAAGGHALVTQHRNPLSNFSALA